MRYLENLILEGKFWNKDISFLFNWLESKSDSNFIFLDTETTGLNHPKYEQLTQVSAIRATYNSQSLKFKEDSKFNSKIKLTSDTKDRMQDPKSKIKWVLGFNRYGNSGAKYYDEQNVLNDFRVWIGESSNILVIQNAQFDMRFLNVRFKINRFDQEVLDTKDIVQLFYIPTIQKLAETDPTYNDLIKKIGTSERDRGLISSSMSKIGPALGLDMKNYHDALQDCVIMKSMLESILSFLKDHESLDISKYQLERIKTK